MPTYEVGNANARETIEAPTTEEAMAQYLTMHPEEFHNTLIAKPLPEAPHEVLIHLNVTVPAYVARMGNDAAVEFATKEVEVAVKAGRLHEYVAMAELT